MNTLLPATPPSYNRSVQLSLLSDAMGQTGSGARQRSRSAALSTAAHVIVLLGALGVFTLHRGSLKPTDRPGIAHGERMTLVYDAGSPPPAAPVVATPPKPSLLAARTPITAPKPAPTTPSATPSTSGIGTSGTSSDGDADVRIALPQYHPRPEPDLATLPAGDGGDEVLNALIDAQGHIAQLTIERSLGAAIDKTVIATVQKWTFSPATRDGVPTASEQEILFHYQRG